MTSPSEKSEQVTEKDDLSAFIEFFSGFGGELFERCSQLAVDQFFHSYQHGAYQA
jgi:hypothetical protein